MRGLAVTGVQIFFFFFQAEDGIRDVAMTGVQTCALPIYREAAVEPRVVDEPLPPDRRARLLEVHAHDETEVRGVGVGERLEPAAVLQPCRRIVDGAWRSEERRVGKECRSRWSPYH